MIFRTTKKTVDKLGLALFITLTTSFNAFAEELTINFTGASEKQGDVIVAIFNQAKEFPSGKPIKLITQAPTIKMQKVTLQKGTYAVAVFQDHNHNKKLDLNFFKIPKEKTGISGKRSFGKPKFSNASFKLVKNTAISIHLK